MCSAIRHQHTIISILYHNHSRCHYLQQTLFPFDTHRQPLVSYFKPYIIRHAEAVDLDDYRTGCAAKINIAI